MSFALCSVSLLITLCFILKLNILISFNFSYFCCLFASCLFCVWFTIQLSCFAVHIVFTIPGFTAFVPLSGAFHSFVFSSSSSPLWSLARSGFCSYLIPARTAVLQEGFTFRDIFGHRSFPWTSLADALISLCSWNLQVPAACICVLT